MTMLSTISTCVEIPEDLFVLMAKALEQSQDTSQDDLICSGLTIAIALMGKQEVPTES